MFFKNLFKKHRLLSLLLSFPFLGMAVASISSQVTPPTLECIEQSVVQKCADLVGERLTLAKELAAYKWNHTLPIESSEQEHALVDLLIKHSDTKVIDPQSLEQFFTAQIDASQALIIEQFEVWVNEGVHKHDYTPDPIVLQQKIDAIDKQLVTTLNNMHTLLCGEQKVEFKVALGKALHQQGFSRDIIDAATRF